MTVANDPEKAVTVVEGYFVAAVVVVDKEEVVAMGLVVLEYDCWSPRGESHEDSNIAGDDSGDAFPGVDDMVVGPQG